jgi:hypothetical protein
MNRAVNEASEDAVLTGVVAPATPESAGEARTGADRIRDEESGAPRRLWISLGALAFRAVGFVASGLLFSLPFGVLGLFRRAMTRGAMSSSPCGSGGWTNGFPPIAMGAVGSPSSWTGSAFCAPAAGSSSQDETRSGAAAAVAVKEVES